MSKEIDDLVEAVTDGNLKEVKRLFEKGVDINSLSSGGHTPLSSASFNGSKELVDFLLEKGADANKKTHENTMTLLAIASNFNYLLIMKSLLEYGAKHDQKGTEGKTAFFGVGSSEAMDLLLEAGANINFLDNHGNSPLLHAIYFQADSSNVRALVEKGSDMAIKNSEGYMALDLALFNYAIEENTRDKENIEVLLKAKAPLSERFRSLLTEKKFNL